MRYHSTSDAELKELLECIGVRDTAELFGSIPEDLRFDDDLEIPGPLAELELQRRLGELAARNQTAAAGPSFLGAGAYQHHVPAVVDHLLLRGEFLTAYTPYQAEISQGTLQAIFEFQTLIAQLTEMDVANASLYDGATAVAEAAFMAQRITRRRRVLLSRGIHPHYRDVVHSLARYSELSVEEFRTGPTGRVDTVELEGAVGEDVAAVVVQSPNFFGCIEDLKALGETVHRSGALFVVNVVEALSMGLLAGAGRFGADIVVGEGQSFGLSLAHGGPYLGLMATRQKFVRQMPGRLAGEARDERGNRGFALTLSTREQHIRRERATSNICTNQGLCALAATIYLALMGRRGLRLLAQRNLDMAAYTRQRVAELDGFELPFCAPTFNEFVVRLPGDAAVFRERLVSQGIAAGLPLGRYEPDLGDCLLVCATELTRREDVDRLVAGLRQAAKGGTR